jgi:site-specific recombinase XerD
MKKHAPRSPRKILQSYREHLEQVAGLAPSTWQNHLRHVAGFLEAVPIRRAADLTALTPVEVTGYLSARSASYQPASLRQIAGSLRQFLRFSQQQGWIEQSLSLAVPQIACRTTNDLPGYLTEPQLAQLLHSCDIKTADGRRDRAILVCLARLGLRAGELASVELHDIDWRQGTLRLQHTKNGRSAELPLLEDVGQALASYLRRDRPDCAYPQVFLLDSPSRPMNRHVISSVVQRGLRRCGIEVPRPGAHLLRHTLASHLTQKGASLKEIADLLRHQHVNSASVYAHVDLPALQALTQPWPKEVAL